MRTMISFGFSFILLMTRILTANAADCEKALIKDTYNSSAYSAVSWKAARLITEEDYNDIRKNLKGEAVIYGIPMGGGWEDFKTERKKRQEQSFEAFSSIDATNIAQALISPETSKNYQACIEAELNQYGVHIAVKNASDVDSVLLLRYTASVEAPTTVDLKWSGDRIPKSLPKKITSGGGNVIIPIKRDKNSDIVLAVNRTKGGVVIGGGYVTIARASLFNSTTPSCPTPTPEVWVTNQWRNVGAGQIANWVNQTCAPVDSSGIRGGVEMQGPNYDYKIYIFCRNDKGRLPPSPYIWQLDRAASMEITPNDKTKVLIGKVLGRINDTVIGLQQIPRP
ncbi:hypothetical protein [Xanthobacter autotrophicus]|uniref:hypothetical protein n=1 Tax=Xanthobacter autotrophicus TaxID=280 RepID=UPI0037274C0F